MLIDTDEPIDFSDLLDDFMESVKEIEEGDAIVLKLARGVASIEVFVNGYSVLKQERRSSELPVQLGLPVTPN